MIKRYFAKRNNPWELLVLAALFSIPAIIILLQKQPFIFPSFGSRVAQIALWSPTELHVLGWFGVIVAAALVFLYFYARRSIGREEKASRPHFLDV
jgi:uncharacterized membrane protein YdjX (TVP38/TMEM64 family)